MIRKLISQYKNSTKAAFLTERIGSFGHISRTSKLAATFYAIQKNAESLSEWDQKQLLRAAGLDIKNREQTFISLLRTYSAPWYKRLFTGDIRNRHVHEVREILRQYEENKNFDDLRQSINALDKVAGDHLGEVYTFFDEHCVRQDEYLANKKEREWREACENKKKEFIENVTNLRDELQEPAKIFNRAYALLGHTEDYKSLKAKYDNLMPEFDKIIEETAVKYDTVSDVEYSHLLDSVEKKLNKVNNEIKSLGLKKIIDEYHGLSNSVREIKDEFYTSYVRLKSHYRFMKGQRDYVEEDKLELEGLLISSKEILDKAKDISNYTDLEWLNNTKDIHALCEKINQQSSKWESLKILVQNHRARLIGKIYF